MDGKTKGEQWQWKEGSDRSRRNEIRRKPTDVPSVNVNERQNLSTDQKTNGEQRQWKEGSDRSRRDEIRRKPTSTNDPSLDVNEKQHQSMDEKTRGDQWQWKMGSDRSRRDEIHRKTPNDPSSVVYRQKKPDHRRQKTSKKRWSVRPDINIARVSPRKQCRMIGAIVLIFFGVFLALSGLVVLFILKNVTTLFLGIGIGVLVLGIIIFIAGLIYMLCICCFKTSTRYKQYIAEFKHGETCEIREVADQPGSSAEQSVTSKTTLQTNAGNHSSISHGSVGDVDFSQPADSTTSRTYVTATENTPSVGLTPGSPKRSQANSNYTTPKGYRPLMVSELTEFKMDMQTADVGDFDDVNGHGGEYRYMAGSPMASPDARDPLKDDFAKLEEALREMVMNKSVDQEVMNLMNQRRPVDTSTPIGHRTLTVPITIEKGGAHRSTPPTPVPPSYDQVIKNYRTYSRSTSPTRLMESDI